MIVLSVGAVYVVGISFKLLPFASQDIASKMTSTAVATISRVISINRKIKVKIEQMKRKNDASKGYMKEINWSGITMTDTPLKYTVIS